MVRALKNGSLPISAFLSLSSRLFQLSRFKRRFGSERCLDGGCERIFAMSSLVPKAGPDLCQTTLS